MCQAMEDIVNISGLSLEEVKQLKADRSAQAELYQQRLGKLSRFFFWFCIKFTNIFRQHDRRTHDQAIKQEKEKAQTGGGMWLKKKSY